MIRLSPATQVRIDPHHQLLMQRRMGERVKFELRAPAAKAVSLAGTFTIKPIPTNRDGDSWRIELPLSEGRYDWAWEVDGKQLDSHYDGQPGYGARIVQPLERLTSAYPQ